MLFLLRMALSVCMAALATRLLVKVVCELLLRGKRGRRGKRAKRTRGATDSFERDKRGNIFKTSE
jgi:hypothetical protein